MYGGIINSLTKLHLVGYCHQSFLFSFYNDFGLYIHQLHMQIVCDRNIVFKIEFYISTNRNATAMVHLSTLGTNSCSFQKGVRIFASDFVEFFKPQSPSNDIPVNLVSGVSGVATQIFCTASNDGRCTLEKMQIVRCPPSVRVIWQLFASCLLVTLTLCRQPSKVFRRFFIRRMDLSTATA